eukprot:13930841-Heterocapsa_arctica.AAC.1
MEHDLDGSGLAHFIEATETCNNWEEFKQIAVFAHTHKSKVEVLGYVMEMQSFDGAETEQDKTVTRVRYSKYSKWVINPITMICCSLMWIGQRAY